MTVLLSRKATLEVKVEKMAAKMEENQERDKTTMIIF